MTIEPRLQQLNDWLRKTLTMSFDTLSPVSGDCSFRRYFRIHTNKISYIVMDAPPEKEPCTAFIAIANSLRKKGVNTPTIYEADLDQGFLLLSDFGDDLYLNALNAKTAPELYQQAFQDLLCIQSGGTNHLDGYQLPLYDANLYQQEMDLFKEWYLKKYLQIELTASENSALQDIYKRLIEDALSQPQTCVHRDYHSRNLMLLPNQQIGILDFQDAVQGPITYDLLSLLRDCYIDWPDEQVTAWVLNFREQALQKGILMVDNPQLFLRWFDWIGLQRHLKCFGIFTRKYKRDDNPNYLQYLPRLVQYTKMISGRYPEFAALHKILKSPAINRREFPV